MNHADLIAIDVHTHAEVSCRNPFDAYGEEYDRAADKYFGSTRRPTIAETIAYYRERKIAAVIFGGWTLRGAVAGCLLFGYVDALRLNLPGILGYSLNSQLLMALPFLATIVVMMLFAKHTRQPASLARPFMRGLK